MNLGERYKQLRLSVKDALGQPISIKDFAANCVKLQAPRISELENNKREMSLTELKAYHEYFKVSFEYLLGETDVKTVNDKVQAAIEVTGLSEKAVCKLTSIKNDPFHDVLIPIISGIIETDSFRDLMYSIWFMSETSFSETYTQEIKWFLQKIIENSDFSLEIRENFFQRYANCFGYSAESIYQDADYRRRTNKGWTDLSLPENYGLLRVPHWFDLDAKEEIELFEYRCTKQFKKILEEFLTATKQLYPSHKEHYDELVKTMHRFDGTNEYKETEEEQRFGEYIRNLLEEEAENNGKHNPTP